MKSRRIITIFSLLCVSALLWTLPAAAQPQTVANPPTARNALATLRTYSGERAVSQILSLTGEEGRTQPQIWEFTLLDPQARSGRRIVRIAGGQVFYDQQAGALLSNAQPRPTLNINRFSVDSDRAFAIANEEAIKARAAYNHANYELFPGSPENTPTWVLTLINDQAQVLGKVTINASSGLVLESRWDPQLTGANAGQTTAGGTEPAVLEKAGRSIDKAVDRVGDSIRRVFNQ